jgi:NADH dehydrogenase
MTNAKNRVLILGGGFGGIKAALELCKHTDLFEVTLLSNKDIFQYYPAIYHTATGGAAAESSLPLLRIFQDKKIALARGTAVKIDRKKKFILTEQGDKFHYDTLIISLGSVPNYFGIKGIEEYSYNIKTPEETKRLKDHLHKQLTDQRKPDLNYVVVGGGPTGIELSGALVGYVKEIMKAHGIKHRAVHVDLVEAAPKLVPRMPSSMSRAIQRRLRHLGVKLYLGKTVEGATADELTVDGKPIQSHTIIWTAGITNHPFFRQNNFRLNPRSKVEVDDYLQAEPDVFVIGDNADTQYSGMAQTALYDGTFVGKNLVKRAKGQLMERYKPKEPIYVIPAGEGWAAVLWGKVKIYGFIGWILRSLADLRGFSDYEPWWRAGKQWMTTFMEEEDCPTCAKRGIF